MSTTADDGIDSDPRSCRQQATRRCGAASSDLSDPHLGLSPDRPPRTFRPKPRHRTGAQIQCPACRTSRRRLRWSSRSRPSFRASNGSRASRRRRRRSWPPAARRCRDVSRTASFRLTLDVSQGSRGSCWAFAGIAALEAAYARINVAARPLGAVPVPHLQGARESPHRRRHQFVDRLSRQLRHRPSPEVLGGAVCRAHVPVHRPAAAAGAGERDPRHRRRPGQCRRRDAGAGRLVRVRPAQHPADGPLVRAVPRQGLRQDNRTSATTTSAARWPPATTSWSTCSTRSTTAATCC